jgi:hypothetical protein
MRLFRSTLVATALTLSIARPASADDVPEQNRVLARALFEQARQLMAGKKFEEACAKLTESARLDPAAGTRLNLATCHEAVGKTATAWAEFNDALTQARRDNRPERVDFALKHIAALEPQLSRLTVMVAPGAEVDGTIVKLDGVVLGRAAWGVSAPVDPGAHAVVATAPRHADWTGGVNVGPKGDQKTIVIPALAETPAPRETSVAPQPSSTPGPTTTSATPNDAESGGGGGGKTTAYIVGGVGIAAVAVGTVFGISALSSWSTRNAHCGAAGCDSQGVSSGNDAKTAAWVADFAVGGGIAAIGVAVVMLFTSGGSASRPSDAWHVAPSVGTTGGGVVLGRGF